MRIQHNGQGRRERRGGKGEVEGARPSSSRLETGRGSKERYYQQENIVQEYSDSFVNAFDFDTK